MNIQVKQTNHTKRAGVGSFKVKGRTLEPEWISAIPHENGTLSIRIDLGEHGSCILDVVDADELKVLAAVVNKAIKNNEEN